MDPLTCLCEDIAPLILQHLNVRDLLNCTKVSRNWNTIIGSSTRIMSKVWLRFYEPLNDINALLKSERKYCNFKIQRGLPPKLTLIIDKFIWKNVMMRDETKIEHETLVKFLNKFAPTLETLDLWDIATKSSETSSTIHINFPQLKELELNLTNRAVLTLFFGNNPKLKKATIRNESARFQNVQREIMEPTNLIHEFLLQNPIEILNILHCEWAFETDLTEGLSTQFKSLTVTSSSESCSPDIQLNILKLVKHQPIKNLKASKEEVNGGKRFLTVYYC